MKKFITIVTVLAVMAGTLAGCGKAPAAQETAPATQESTPTEEPAQAEASAQESAPSGEAQTVATDGSTSMEKVIGVLSEVYMEENKNVTVTYNPTGSGAGIEAVSAGRCDIGLSSRDLKDEEAATLEGTVVAIDGIGIIVHPNNKVADLTVEQIGKIYKGEITDWKEVGGDAAPIVCIGREAGSGTRDGFEAVTGTKDSCKYGQELTSTGDVITTVAGNPNAIGYASVASIKETVKTVSVEGIMPTAETVQSGEYKVQRNFVLVTKKDTPLSDAAQAFFDFATSEAADSLITEAGAFPVKR